MLEVGVAVRLGRFPSEARAQPFEDLQLVAAYCALEAEELERSTSGGGAASSRAAPARRTVTTEYRLKRK